MAGDSNQVIAELKGHEGPVWQVQWSHPKWQSILASCSYDRSVIIWKETAQNTWTEAYRHLAHELSVNSVCWAPHDFGLVLAAASSDGHISVLSLRADVSLDADCAAMVAAAEDAYGHLDVLFNNAGVMIPGDDDAVTTEES